MSPISFVYFDVGGVAIKDFSDSPKWVEMLSFMGLPGNHIKKIDSLYDRYEDDICIGKRHVDTLVPIYKNKYQLTIPDDFSMQKYFIDHFDPNPGIQDLVNQLTSKVKMGLLTDQYPGMLEEVFSRHILPNYSWDAVVNSSVVGLRKPWPEIYELAQQRAGVPGEEIFFIDNREKNLVPARHLGWQTFLYDSSNYSQANQDLADFIKKNI